MKSLNLAKNVRHLISSRKPSSQKFDLFEKNFCLLDQFRRRLFIEKRRGERLNYRSSIILFNCQNYFNSTVRQKNLPGIIKLICSIIRATDLICLYKSNTLLILLPDTDNQGARYVCERLLSSVIANLNSNSRMNTAKREDFEIEILSYPEKLIEQRFLDDNFLDSSKIVSANWENERVSSVIPDRNIYNMNYYSHLNLSVSTYNASSVAMPIVEPFFWDQESIQNMLAFLNKFAKRALDILVSMLALMLAIPILLPIALLIKLTSKGPVLFKQDRVGYRGKNFTFYKFRTMYQNSDTSAHQEYMKKHILGNNEEINNGEKDNPLFKMTNDSRITPIGKFLRKTSLDELPQLWNVLKGEMSLVGPRPPIPYEVEEYQNWHYRRVIEVKPGITGLWQVSGRNRTTFDEMVRLDIQYARNWSFLFDVKILMKTFMAIFKGEGN